MIYTKITDEIYRGLRRSKSPDWPGWAKIDELRKKVEKSIPFRHVERVLANEIKEDATINAMYAAICKDAI